MLLYIQDLLHETISFLTEEFARDTTVVGNLPHTVPNSIISIPDHQSVDSNTGVNFNVVSKVD